MNRARGFLIIVLTFTLLFLSGCIKRNLHIKSDPPGATIYLNDKEIGTTPLDFDFMWYATHKIELKKENYKPLVELIRIRMPIYLWPPLDFVLELVPYTFWDKRELDYTLVPSE